MRSRINAVVMLAAAFIAFTAVSSAKGVQTSRHQLPTAVLMDGPGPMCPPTSGCGNENATAAKDTQVRGEILLVDGGGPMCFPSTGCGYRGLDFLSEQSFQPAVLLADGGGPMCFPSTGCGRVGEVPVKRLSVF